MEGTERFESGGDVNSVPKDTGTTVSRSASLPTYQGVRWLFPRLLAAVYLIAFASWGVQYRGLVGEDGILPAPRLIANIEAYEEREGKSLLWECPTLLRFNATDAFALGLITVCCVLALLVMAGLLQRILLILLWAGYLSLVVTGDVFMGFQWDALLLEAGLLAVWLAPGRLWAGRALSAPPRGSVFLLHWLTYRLMFLSGFVKIAGGDEVWENMTALLFHYETQPLPNVPAWWAHQLPREVHVASCWAMYGVELVLPFVMFLGRWGRLAACAGFLALMVGVAATGNYNFFNLTTAVLALTLLDDSWWPARIRKRLRMDQSATENARPIWLKRLMRSLAALTISFVVVATMLAADQFLSLRIPGFTRKLPDSWHTRIHAQLSSLRSFNAYGLFQDMTVERPEIVIDVSDDGILWLPLEFRWKPGSLDRPPGQAAPHQPRLDWQMWFAALHPGFVPQRDAQPNSPIYWFGEFLGALLQQKQAVWDLLEPPPFPQADIRHVRARLYRYHFTDVETKRQSGHYWRREFLGSFSPAFSARE